MTTVLTRMLTAVGAAALMLLLACCSSSGARHAPPAAGSPTGAPSSLPAPSPPATPQPAPGPALVAWGTTDGLLSVVVENQSALEISAAHVLITALDAAGHPVASTSGTAGSKCCTILGLPPRHRFGLFADLGPLVQRVRGVRVRYLAVHMQPWQPARAGSVAIRDPVLGAEPNGDAVVTATLAATGPVGPYVVGQVFLAGPDGRLVGVISGRFWCFGDGVSRQRRLQLLHPVPPQTRIAGVAAYPVPPGRPSGVAATCPG